jgi:hypothetical protein
MRKLALTNGNVITVDRENPRAHSVFIVGDRIVKVGSDEEIRGLFDEETEVIDLEGRTLRGLPRPPDGIRSIPSVRRL